MWLNGALVIGALVIDRWVDGSNGTASNALNLAAGVPAAVQVEYYENGGGANMYLWYISGGVLQMIPPAG